ncbi:unnamed protein product [Microthlaspi erraticum]|uniref:Reverse transcriptase domain-containing protein n=1 Tax=Microthlaspi erraticum TaxID=1685480 RepID=A0A6D2HM22_9BRAS|nr:unnamed protein product [Microthlaspi erraticum]
MTLVSQEEKNIGLAPPLLLPAALSVNVVPSLSSILMSNITRESNANDYQDCGISSGFSPWELNIESCETLMSIIRSYEAASGQVINAQKSSISFSRKTLLEVKERVKLALGRGQARSKRDGGLGIRKIQSFNDSLLAKLSWRLLTKPSSLVARVLLGKYCKDKGLLDVSGHTSSSHSWRGILIGRDLLSKQLGVVIGDGKDTSVWDDPWLSLETVGSYHWRWENLCFARKLRSCLLAIAVTL